VDIDFLGPMNNDPVTAESMTPDVYTTKVKPDGLLCPAETGKAERITEDAE
jgi:hypothetical protein